MLLNTVIWVFMVGFDFVYGQIEYDPVDNRLVCPRPNASYCLAESGSGAAMISCVSSSLAEVISCNLELSSILPAIYSESAVCYESLPDSGVALCAFNGTGYTLNGSIVSIPETALCPSADPLSAQGEDQTQSTPGTSPNKRTGSFIETASNLIIHLFTASDHIKQKTAHCSRPHVYQYSSWNQKTITSAVDTDANKHTAASATTIQTLLGNSTSRNWRAAGTKQNTESTNVSCCLVTAKKTVDATTGTSASCSLPPFAPTNTATDGQTARTAFSIGAASARNVNTPGLLLAEVLLLAMV